MSIKDSEKYADNVLKNEYSDYYKNKWHYECQRVMLIDAYLYGKK